MCPQENLRVLLRPSETLSPYKIYGPWSRFIMYGDWGYETLLAGSEPLTCLTAYQIPSKLWLLGTPGY